jgi:hypothetical protein
MASEGIVSWGARFLDALDSEGHVKPDRRRDVAVALAAYATNDGRGRGLGDPVHELVTEGRRLANEQRRRHGSPEVPYYSCCDLGHWLLSCLGCTDEAVVNRTDDGGHVPWLVSVNFSRLRGAKAFRLARGVVAQPGDILLIDHAGGHAAVVRLGRGEAGLRRLDGGLVKSAAVGGVAVGDEETTR